MKPLLILGVTSVLTTALSVAAAQEQPAGAPSASPAPAEEVIVTGTRRQDRTVTESSAPIDVLSGTDRKSTRLNSSH